MPRSDGFYFCPDDDGRSVDWLRFYDDGHVSNVAVVPEEGVDGVARWFGRDHDGSLQGTWWREGDVLRCTTVGTGIDDDERPMVLVLEWRGSDDDVLSPAGDGLRAGLVMSVEGPLGLRAGLRFAFVAAPR